MGARCCSQVTRTTDGQSEAMKVNALRMAVIVVGVVGVVGTSIS